MKYRMSLILTGSLFLLLSLVPPTSQAQEWAQEAEVITSISYNGPLHVLLDSLSWTLDRHPDTHVRRSPQDSTSRSYRTIREDLYEEGVSLPSASHALIRYRFDLTKDGNHIVETIQDIHFILRLNKSREDISILYIQLDEPVIRKVVNTRGITSEMNMKNLTTFRDLMTFPALTASSETDMVGMGGQPLRGLEGPHKQAILLEQFRDHTYVLGSIPSTQRTPPTAIGASASRE